MSTYVAQKTELKNRTVSLFLALITLTSGFLAALPAASAVSVDDISPVDGTYSNSLSFLPMRANVTPPDPVMVGVSSALEWGAGDFGTDTQFGASGLELRSINSENWASNAIDSTVWESQQMASVSGNVLNLTGDGNSGLNAPYVRSLYTLNLANELGIVLNATGTATADEAMYGLMPGAFVNQNTYAYVGFYFYGYSEDNYHIQLVGSDNWYYNNIDAGVDIPLGQVTSVSLTLSALTVQSATHIRAQFDGSYLDLGTGQWTSIGSVYLNVYNTAYQVGMGSDVWAYCCDGSLNSIEVSSISVNKTIYADSGQYVSVPVMLPTMKGAYLTSVNVTTNNGGMNGIADIMVSTALNDTGPWSAPFDATTVANQAIDQAIDGPWVQFTIDLTPAVSPSWITSVEFWANYHTEVGLYWYDDLSGAVNQGIWTYSGGGTTSEGLWLDSTSSEASIGITYPNASWDISGPHRAETLSLVRAVNGDSVASGGSGSLDVLLSGFLISSGSSTTGYVGVVRAGDASNAYWAIAWMTPGGSDASYSADTVIMTSGASAIRTTLVNGVFHAWVLELDNAWRGWIDLGSAALGMSSGTAWWRQGDVGSHTGVSTAVVDWSALLIRWMTPPVFGSSWDAGNTNLNEYENGRAVIALAGPTWGMQTATYILDTTPPTGDFFVGNHDAFTTSLSVTLHLSASDRYGVSEYAASESLSFPEGFRAYTANPSFLLSPGDGRKVIWVQFKDAHGVLSTPINQSIQLDTVDPEGTLYINERAASTTVTNVSLLLLANDIGGVEYAKISNDAQLPMNQWTTVDLKDYTNPNNPVVNQSVTQNVNWTLSAGDGVKYVWVQYIDVHGRASRIVNSTILLDSTAPQVTGSLLGTIQRGGTTYLNTTRAVVRVAASDASGVASIEISESNTFATSETYTSPGDLVYLMTGSSGNRTLFVRATDIFGLISSPMITISFFVDVSAPTGTISINGGADTTTSRTVTLNLTATDNIGVESMQLSTSLYFPGATWQAFAPQVSLDLSAGDGPAKTVYVRFRDVNGRESQAFFDTIALDTTPPTGFIILNNGDLSTTDRNLNLQLEAFDNFQGQLEMRYSLNASFSNAPWLPFSDSVRFDGGTEEGNVVVYYQIRDVNGLMSEVYSDGIRIRKQTCEEAGNCSPVGSPGFEGPVGVAALAMVAVVAAALRRKDE